MGRGQEAVFVLSATGFILHTRTFAYREYTPFGTNRTNEHRSKRRMIAAVQGRCALPQGDDNPSKTPKAQTSPFECWMSDVESWMLNGVLALPSS
jgi:hypothetical protein